MDGESSVLIWWSIMAAITVFNLLFLIWAYRRLKSELPSMSPILQKIRNWQFALASIYMLGCGSRALIPRGDLRRIGFWDSWLSSIVLGRSIATIAELSFVAQWCLILYEAGKHTGNKSIQFLAKLPFPIIFIAEISSWYACTTSNYLGTAIEESLWALAAAITIYGFYLALPYYKGIQKRFLNMAILAGIAYVIYMLGVDVPTYISNWQAAEAAGKTYLTVADGLAEISTTWNYTRAYVDWEYEMVWMTLYFSLAVWMSIYIVNAPKLDQNVKAN
ncbi:MAG: hypothetical protein MK212_15390 [Saprospiraceae bacterium]|nr:hypothetical protein [Saprospiraceae bacterium]